MLTKFLFKGREGQRVDQLGVDSLRKSDPDRPGRSGQERSRSDSYIQPLEQLKTIMNMKQEGPFLGEQSFYFLINSPNLPAYLKGHSHEKSLC
jgi:hypothetical protein